MRAVPPVRSSAPTVRNTFGGAACASEPGLTDRLVYLRDGALLGTVAPPAAAVAGMIAGLGSFVTRTVDSFSAHPLRSTLFAGPVLTLNAAKSAWTGGSAAVTLLYNVEIEAAINAGAALGLVDPSRTWAAKENVMSGTRQQRASWAEALICQRFPAGWDSYTVIRSVLTEVDRLRATGELSVVAHQNARRALVGPGHTQDFAAPIIGSGRIEQLAASVWKAIEAYDGSEAERSNLKLSLARSLGAMIAQQLLTVLQGYYDEVALDTVVEPGMLLCALGLEHRAEQGHDPEGQVEIDAHRIRCLAAAQREYAEDPTRLERFRQTLTLYLESC
jgi:hypothetical protein